MIYVQALIKKILKILIVLFIIIFSFTIVSYIYAYVNVKGYYRKDGTYVRSHVRSNPNGLKYDNYGYKPSQGLYNDTYGTRGSEWDTPTTITDPDYYEDKALYETGLSGQNTNLGTVFKINTPITCTNGYSRFRGHCYKIPTNTHAIDSNTDAWLCDTGYKEVGYSCVK